MSDYSKVPSPFSPAKVRLPRIEASTFTGTIENSILPVSLTTWSCQSIRLTVKGSGRLDPELTVVSYDQLEPYKTLTRMG